MFNLLVKYVAWDARQDSLPSDRLFEFTEPGTIARFSSGGVADFHQLARLPTLLVTEVEGQGTQNARFVTITSAQKTLTGINLSYSPIEGMPAIPNRYLVENAQELLIAKFEFSRTHWSVKDIDIYKFLFQRQIKLMNVPKVFTVASVEDVDQDLVSAMMPFDRSFDEVYQAIKASAARLNLRCERADDIWKNDAIIQDVVQLISKARIVVCDCTGKNANVFYETGIAHALGRDTILITQSEADIPFDLRHLRYIRYLGNTEGRGALTEKLTERMTTLRGATS